jgi:hypothetical protein
MNSLPRAHTGVGSATNGVFIQVGGALGVAVIGSLLSTRYQDRMMAALASVPVPHAIQNIIAGSIGGALGVAAQVGGELGRLLTQAARSAFISGGDLGLLTGAAIVLAGSVLALVTVPAGPRTSAPSAAPATPEDGQARETGER